MTTDPRVEATVRADTRRRVLATFVTRGGPHEAPTGPRVRLVVMGAVATMLLLVGGVVSGRLSPSTPGSWPEGDIVVGRTSAARLVSVGGVLHPLLNTTSGRLLGPASSRSRVTVVEDAAIDGARRGAPLGIPGAPDVLPVPAALVQSGWLACLDGTRVRTRITSPIVSPAAGSAASSASTPAALSDEQAVVVSVVGLPDEIHLVVGDRRFRIPAASFAAVKQYLDQTSSPRPAAQAWVDLFPTGTDLAFGSFRFVAPATVGRPTGPGLTLRGVETRVGQLVTNTDRLDASFVIVADGAVPLTAFAAAIYRGTAPGDLGTPLAVTDEDLARLPPSSNASLVPEDWPAASSEATPGTSSGTSSGPTSAALVPCAELSAAGGRSPTTSLRLTTAAAPDDPSTPPGRASPSGDRADTDRADTDRADTGRADTDRADTAAPVMDPGGGAVVSVVTGEDDSATVYLVDPSGRAFPVGAPAADTLARLGYAGVAPSVVPAGWIALCPPGPEISVAAAQLRGQVSGPA